MAKHIKAIKCPHCGSVAHTQLRDDYYQCKNCGTEYYLDNDDININHNYRYENNEQKPAFNKTTKATLIVLGGLFLLFICINIARSIFRSEKAPRGVTKGITATKLKKAPKKRIYWYNKKDFQFVDKDNRPLFIRVGEKRESVGASSKDSVLFVVYDLLDSNKIIFRQELEFKPSSLDTRFKLFENGDLYFTLNNKKLFQADIKNKSIQEITAEHFSDIAQLRVGFAKVEFVYNGQGDGFKFLTNEGKQLYYFPLIDKLYNDNEFFRAQAALSGAMEHNPLRTGYSFSEKSMEYKDEKIQLIKYFYYGAEGYPKRSPIFRWSRDFGPRSGIFTERDPFTKTLLSVSGKKLARIKSYKDFTPGRLYFHASVLDFTDKQVLIAYKPTPASDDSYSIQLLNAENGAIIWTLTGDRQTVKSGKILGNTCLVNNTLIGMDGKVQRELNLPK